MNRRSDVETNYKKQMTLSEETEMGIKILSKQGILC